MKNDKALIKKGDEPYVNPKRSMVNSSHPFFDSPQRDPEIELK